VPCLNKESDNPTRDIFISYSHKDIEWVNEFLLPMIESWQLVYASDADFLPGPPLPTTILEFITTSKHVIFVCTKNFINSDWCNSELQQAITHDPGSITLKAIAVVLDKEAVPPLLMHKRWCDLSEAGKIDELKEWKKLCEVLDGKWSPASSRIFNRQNALSLFFGNMRDNSAETTILARSHSTTEITGISNVLSVDTARGLSYIYSFLAKAGKTRGLRLVLSDGSGNLSDPFDENVPMNLIIFGGTSQGNRILDRISKGLIHYKQDSEEPKYCYEIRGNLFVPNQDHMSFIIYKSRTEADNTVLVLFSPWPYANRFAAQYFSRITGRLSIKNVTKSS
jgi:hypothetical protein